MEVSSVVKMLTLKCVRVELKMHVIKKDEMEILRKTFKASPFGGVPLNDVEQLFRPCN